MEVAGVRVRVRVGVEVGGVGVFLLMRRVRCVEISFNLIFVNKIRGFDLFYGLYSTLVVWYCMREYIHEQEDRNGTDRRTSSNNNYHSSSWPR